MMEYKFTKYDALVWDFPNVMLTPHDDYAVVWHGCELYVTNDRHDAARWMKNFIRVGGGEI
jgi:hypothetical protein